MSDETDDESKPAGQVYGGAVPLRSNARASQVMAAAAVKDKTPRLRVMVLDWIRKAGDAGLSNKELGARWAGVKGKQPTDASCRYTMSPRCTELHLAGFIEDSGVIRDFATVWRATAQEGDGSVVPKGVEQIRPRRNAKPLTRATARRKLEGIAHRLRRLAATVQATRDAMPADLATDDTAAALAESAEAAYRAAAGADGVAKSLTPPPKAKPTEE